MVFNTGLALTMLRATRAKLVNYVAMLLVVCQLSHDVISYEDS